MTDYTGDTVYSLLRRADTRPASIAAWVHLALLGLAAWAGSTAFLGQYRTNEVSALLYRIAAPRAWFVGAVAVTVLVALAGLRRRNRSLAGGALVVAAFLLANLLYREVVPRIPSDFDVPLRGPGDVVGFVSLRLAWGACLTLIMLAAWRIAFGGRGAPALTLGIGAIRRAGRDTSLRRPPTPWLRVLWTGYGGFVLVLLVLLQASVGFRGFRSGEIWVALPGILVAAFANATAEEYVFRGVLMPAFMRVGGIGAGLWAQGAVFGLMHWGLSVGVLAALPVSLMIGFGSVIWGKAALDTGGMLWVVIAHAMIDVAVMAAYFV